MLENTGIRETVLRQIAAFAKEYGLKQVILFGSRARGDHRERSDIDLAVSGGNFPAFALDVDEETDTLLKYDFVNLDAAVQPELLAEIQKDGRILYEKI